MDTLPNETIINIFKYANQSENRLNILLVCKQWCDLFLKYVHQPWNHAGLAYAMEDGYVDYYVKWSTIAGKRWKPTIWDHHGFEMAVSNDHLKMVRVLLADKKIHPFAYSSNALDMAESNENKEMLALLLSDKRVIEHVKKNIRRYSIVRPKNIKSRKDLYYK